MVLGGGLLIATLHMSVVSLAIWFIPATEGISIFSMLMVGTLASLDLLLRAESRAIPMVRLAAMLGLLWLVHLCSFPPHNSSPVADDFTGWLYLACTVMTPLSLSLALNGKPQRQVEHPGRAMWGAVLSGVSIGLGLLICCVLLAYSSLSVVNGPFFTSTAHLVDGVALLVAMGGIVGFAAGVRGDRRIAPAVLSALVLSAITAIAGMESFIPFSWPWYGSHLESMLTSVAMVCGQVILYVESLRSERESQARLEMLLTAEQSLSRSLDPATLATVLSDWASVTARAEHVMVARVETDHLLPLGATGASVRYLGNRIPIIEGGAGWAALRDGETVAVQPSGIHPGYAPDLAGHIASLRHVLMAPMPRMDEGCWVIVAARTNDEPFSEQEITSTKMLAAFASTHFRNAALHSDVTAANEAKAFFMNLAAHELRTPISVLTGYLSLMVDGSLGEPGAKWQQVAGVLHGKGCEMSALVDRMLTAVRLEDNKEPLNLEYLDLRAVVSDAHARSLPRAHLRSAEVRLKIGNRPAVCAIDREQIGVVLDNLINNALTYTEDDPYIRIEVLCDGTRTSVLISDNGVGIPREQQQAVFERLRRLHGKASLEAHGGLGLGLYIARELARRHGGDVVLDHSEPGHGSCFRLSIPLARKPGS